MDNCNKCLFQPICNTYARLGVTDLSASDITPCKLFKDKNNYAEVKHGHWIVMSDCVQATFECSECGFSFTNADPTEECVYFGCPICLAKMDEGSECHGKRQQT